MSQKYIKQDCKRCKNVHTMMLMANGMAKCQSCLNKTKAETDKIIEKKVSRKMDKDIIGLTKGYVIQTDYGFVHVGDDWDYYVSTSFSNGGLAMFKSVEVARKVRDKIKRDATWRRNIRWTKVVRVINDDCFCRRDKLFSPICSECRQRELHKKDALSVKELKEEIKNE